jgi:hypothetical protein
MHSAQSARLRQLFADASARADGDAHGHSHGHSHSHSHSHGNGFNHSHGVSSRPGQSHTAHGTHGSGADAGIAGGSPGRPSFGAGGWSSRVAAAQSPNSPVPDGPGHGVVGVGPGLGWTAEDAKDFAERYPFSVAALSARVIVAADATGYVRVLVRSGGVLRDIP